MCKWKDGVMSNAQAYHDTIFHIYTFMLHGGMSFLFVVVG